MTFERLGSSMMKMDRLMNLLWGRGFIMSYTLRGCKEEMGVVGIKSEIKCIVFYGT